MFDYLNLIYESGENSYTNIVSFFFIIAQFISGIDFVKIILK